ncbi:FecR family protein [Sinomicrobium soli]|uniref:FecR family protein n=1 Tax=Sinomicrobium sp. N-1-3-6 TaxID=2219864 RepID=UPI0011BF69FA|nr:FecR domain-containing protein [Sinomicrobium sp. N-1-3-6]
MKREDYIKQLLYKFVKGECTSEEVDELVVYLRQDEPGEEFPYVEEVLETLEERAEMGNDRADEIYDWILKKGEAQKNTGKDRFRKKRAILQYVPVAAVFIVLLGIGGYFGWVKDRLKTAPASLASEHIVLETKDGKVMVLPEHGQLQLTDKEGNVVGEQEGNRLVYSDSASDNGSAGYNTLRVPYGKHFELRLSDGSEIYMNAGSSLKYPVNFLNTDKREVVLRGEAFFKVSGNKNKPFIVTAENLEVEVLGTEFNVSSYREDEVTNVVLVEGSVKLGAPGNREALAVLEPGQRANFDHKDKGLEIDEVDTGIYTAWMKGELVFRNMSFDNILKKMERHYNIRIVNNDKALGQEKFNAGFENEPIEAILDYFETIYGIHYTRKEDQRIIINP